jgi:hypothetical protein
MKRTAYLGKLIATAALTLGLLGGSAQAASAASKPNGGDFIVNCNQPALVNITVNQASGGSIISAPSCSRDTTIR